MHFAPLVLFRSNVDEGSTQTECKQASLRLQGRSLIKCKYIEQPASAIVGTQQVFEHVKYPDLNRKIHVSIQKDFIQETSKKKKEGRIKCINYLNINSNN